MGYSDVICPYCVIVIYWKFDYCKIGFYKVYIIAQCKILPVTMTDMNEASVFVLPHYTYYRFYSDKRD